MDYNIIKGKSTLTNIVDAYSGVLNVNYTSYVDNGVYLCKISATNTTTAPTLNLNSIGVRNINKNDGNSLAIGDLSINGWYFFMYDLITDSFLKLAS